MPSFSEGRAGEPPGLGAAPSSGSAARGSLYTQNNPLHSPSSLRTGSGMPRRV